MLTRTLGQFDVSAMGMGCWAIGGPWTIRSAYSQWQDVPAGWGHVDDAESIRSIQRGLDLGINLFDTAANYGAGHSERLLGQAITGRRDQVVIATKFGYLVDENSKQVIEENAAVVMNLRQDCEASLRRLNTDYIDLYQFHVNDFPSVQAPEVRDGLEQLVSEGKIRAYGWSTDHPESAQVFAEGQHCVAVQYNMNLMQDAPDMTALCNKRKLAGLIRGPLAMGVLTGKFNRESTFAANDVRSRNFNFQEGRGAETLQKLDALRDILTSGGRTLAQASLGWLWARSEQTIPIPGFKSIAQVEENAGALHFGPLSADQMRQIDQILERDSVL